MLLCKHCHVTINKTVQPPFIHFCCHKDSNDLTEIRRRFLNILPGVTYRSFIVDRAGILVYFVNQRVDSLLVTG